MDKVFNFGLMEGNTVDNGMMIRDMDMECMYIQTGEYMKVPGLMTKKKEKARSLV